MEVLGTAVQEFQRQAALGEEERQVLMAQIQHQQADRLEMERRLQAAEETRANGAGPVVRQRVGVDTRNLGRPEAFDGTDAKWRDWSIVFKSYSLLMTPRLEVLMREAEQSDVPEQRASLKSKENRAASSDLYHLLLHLTRGQALDRTINAGDG